MMKKATLIAMTISSLLVLAACGKKDVEEPVEKKETPAVSETKNENKGEEKQTEKFDVEKVDVKKFIMDNNSNLTDFKTNGENEQTLTVSYNTTESFEDIQKFYTTLGKELKLTDTSEVKSDSEKSWIMVGTMGDADVQFTVVPEEGNTFIVLIVIVA